VLSAVLGCGAEELAALRTEGIVGSV